MAISVVHQNFYSPTFSSGNGTYTIPSTTAGNTLVVFIVQDLSGGAPSSYAPTDNKSNTYHSVFTRSGSSTAMACYVAYNIAASTTTLTISQPFLCCGCGTEEYVPQVILAYEVSGLGTSNPVDVYNSASGTQSGLTSSGNITTTQSTEIVIGAVGQISNSGPTYATDSGFTAGASSSFTSYGDTAWAKSEYQILSSTGTYAASMTATFGTSSANKILAIVGLAQIAAAGNSTNFLAFF